MVALSPTQRQIIVDAVAPRFDEVATRCAERAIAEIPAYADVPVDDVRQGIVADLARATTALIDGRDLTAPELVAMGRIGEHRAEQGIPLEAMLRVYRITTDEIFSVLFESGEQGAASHAEIMALTRHVWRYADQLMDVAVAGYRRREFEQTVTDTHQRAALIHRLLFSTGGPTNAGALAAQLDPRAAYVAVRARSPHDNESSLLLDLQMPGVLEGGAVVPYEGDVVGFATARPTLAPGADVIVAVGPPGPLAALPQSFAVATRVVEAAAAFGRTGVLTLEAVGTQAIARAEDVLGDALTARFVSVVDAELLSTVAAFLDGDLSIERASDALYVHPNTVRNRLRRYEALTDSSLRCVDDLVAIRLALLRAALDA